MFIQDRNNHSISIDVDPAPIHASPSNGPRSAKIQIRAPGGVDFPLLNYLIRSHRWRVGRRLNPHDLGVSSIGSCELIQSDTTRSSHPRSLRVTSDHDGK